MGDADESTPSVLVKEAPAVFIDGSTDIMQIPDYFILVVQPHSSLDILACLKILDNKSTLIKAL